MLSCRITVSVQPYKPKMEVVCTYLCVATAAPFFSTPCKGNIPSSYPHNLVSSLASAHCCRMRMVLLPTALISVSCTVASGPDDALGVWRVRPDSSPGSYSNVLTIRFEPHNSGEVFTLDSIDADGHRSTSSTILYFDGKSRDFQDPVCSGTQSAWRIDSNTVEILRNCANGRLIRFVRRSTSQPKELILEITEKQPDVSDQERRLVLEKQPTTKF